MKFCENPADKHYYPAVKDFVNVTLTRKKNKTAPMNDFS